MSATAVESPKAGAERSAAAFWKNLPGIQYFSGTLGRDNLLKELLRSPSMIPSTTDISPITFGKRKLEKLRQKEGKRERGKNVMSFWRTTNQKTRSAENKCQAGIPHPLRTIPPLPFDNTTYSAHCISRPGCHDCSITCESEITGVYIETHYFYILNEHRFPIELGNQLTIVTLTLYLTNSSGGGWISITLPNTIVPITIPHQTQESPSPMSPTHSLVGSRNTRYNLLSKTDPTS